MPIMSCVNPLPPSSLSQVPQSSSPPQPASEKDQPDQPVQPEPDSIYAELGELEPVNLISFAYQIASGMVSS